MARPKLPPLKLDICKVDTARLRSLSRDDLDNVQKKIGKLYDFPKKDKVIYVFTSDATYKRIAKDPKKFRHVLSQFVNTLIGAKRPLSKYDIREGQETEDRQRIADLRKHYAKDADRIERVIWDAQVHAGCKLRPTELVARDVEIQTEDRKRADEIRRDSRVPTLHKRPAKIR